MEKLEGMGYIAILGGALRQNPDGSWRTCRLGEGDDHGTTGDRLRVIAASLLYKKMIKAGGNLRLIACGGKGRYSAGTKERPILAAVIERELIELDIPQDRIIKEGKSGSSYQQLIGIVKIADKNGWQSGVIMSNDWHLPRVQAMVGSRSELVRLRNSVLIGAEEVLIKMGPDNWKVKIELNRLTEDYRRRLEIEKTGTDRIKAGTYIFK